MTAPLTPAVQAAPTLADPPAREGAEGLSFEAVFTQHAPFVWRALRRLGVREADVEDVCQEVFVVVHRRLATFQGQSAVRTWLYGIAIRVASDYRRRPHILRERAVAEAPDTSVPAQQDIELDRRRDLAWLDGVLDSLDDAKRAVFVLYEVEQVPMAEVAEAVGCPVQTAYARLYAARKHVEAAARREQARRSHR